MSWFQKGSRSGRRKTNPETIVTAGIRDMLRILRVPHFKHFGGPMSTPGVPDIIGTVPGKLLNPVSELSDAVALAGKLKGSVVGSFEEAALVLAKRVVHLEARGSALWCEVKVPGKDAREDQESFLDVHRLAGGLAFVAHDAREVVSALAAFGYEQAKAVLSSIGGGRSGG